MTEKSGNATENNIDYVVALDVGTSFIRVAGALVSDDNDIRVIGYKTVVSSGMGGSGISSLDKLRDDISRAYSAVDTQVHGGIMQKCADIDFDNPRVMVSVPGYFSASRNVDGTTPLHHQRVTTVQMAEAIQNAASVSIDGYDLVGYVVNQYQVDSNERVVDPRGMVGGQLKVFIHAFYAKKDFLDNIRYALTSIRSKYAPDFMFSGYATARGLLIGPEKDIGVCVIDIGGSTADITIYDRGNLIFTNFCRFGSGMVTRDIAVVNGISERQAEQLKLRCGLADPDLADVREEITVERNGLGDDITLQPRALAETIEARYHNIFQNVLMAMKGVDPSCDLGAGMVLAGGGSSIRGIEKCFRKYLESNGISNIRSVRRAAFRETDVPLAEHEGTLSCSDIPEKMNPVSDAVLIGLLKFSNDKEKTLEQTPKRGLARFASKIWDWFNKSM